MTASEVANPEQAAVQSACSIFSSGAAKVFEVERIADLAGRAPSAEFVGRVPIAFARRHRMLGLASDGDDGRLTVAVAELGDLQHLQVLGRFLQMPAGIGGFGTDPGGH